MLGLMNMRVIIFYLFSKKKYILPRLIFFLERDLYLLDRVALITEEKNEYTFIDYAQNHFLMNL